MIETPDATCSNEDTKKPENTDELKVLASWLQEAAAASADIVQLLQLELRLAIVDTKRLFVLALLIVPILLLTWTSFCTVLAWFVYQQNTSVMQGLLAFFILQILALVGILLAWQFYKKSLSLPLTRQHIREFIGGNRNDT